MPRIIFVALVILTLVETAGSGYAADNGQYSIYGGSTCREYSDAYARTKLTGKSNVRGPSEWHNINAWINGYISAYNAEKNNGRKNIIEDTSVNDTLRWMASWCRDNPDLSVHRALQDSIHAIQQKYGFTRKELLGK